MRQTNFEIAPGELLATAYPEDAAWPASVAAIRVCLLIIINVSLLVGSGAAAQAQRITFWQMLALIPVALLLAGGLAALAWRRRAASGAVPA